jgi:hypothetical protein
MAVLKAKNYKNREELITAISLDSQAVLTGKVSELKKLDVDQTTDLGIKIIPDPEIIEAKSIKSREDLDKFIKDLLGDNLTLNRNNGHKIVGKKEELDKLYLGVGSNIYGVKVELI